jgi:hypothetical protein
LPSKFSPDVISNVMIFKRLPRDLFP